MRTRGRISPEAQIAEGLNYQHEKPEPPVELTARQAEEWRAIVGRMRAGWFPRETHCMLTQLVRITDRLGYVAGTINKMQEAGKAYGQSYQEHLRLENDLTKTQAILMARMRITQQSSTSHSKVKGGSLAKPVEAGAGWNKARQSRLKADEPEDEREAA